jgi:hypothetical protein
LSYDIKAGEIFSTIRNRNSKQQKVKVNKVYEWNYSEDLQLYVTFCGSLAVEFEVIDPSATINNIQTMSIEHFHQLYIRSSREVHCWKCKRELNEKTMTKCSSCGYIKCPTDNACLCGVLK